MSIYVTSDWHGCSIAKIKLLLQKALFGPEDRLLVLGDVIDRGVHGIELLKYIMREPNIELIRGDHESMLLSCAFLFEDERGHSVVSTDRQKINLLHSWRSNGGEPTISSLLCEKIETRKAILSYLSDTPLYESVLANGKEYLLVHAGLGNHEGEAIVDFDKVAEETLLWTRIYQTSVYSEKFTTIVGHTPTCVYSKENANRIYKTNTWWDIDTGEACGYSPMLLCLDSLKEYYIEGDGVVVKSYGSGSLQAQSEELTLNKKHHE